MKYYTRIRTSHEDLEELQWSTDQVDISANKTTIRHSGFYRKKAILEKK